MRLWWRRSHHLQIPQAANTDIAQSVETHWPIPNHKARLPKGKSAIAAHPILIIKAEKGQNMQTKLYEAYPDEYAWMYEDTDDDYEDYYYEDEWWD